MPNARIAVIGGTGMKDIFRNLSPLSIPPPFVKGD